MGLVLYLLAATVVIAVLVGVIVLVVGALLGGVLGGLIGGAGGAWKAPAGEGELGAYRGLVWGGCLGVSLGLLAATLLLAAAWADFTSTPPKAPAPDTYPQKEREEPPALRTLPSAPRAGSSAGTSAMATPSSLAEGRVDDPTTPDARSSIVRPVPDGRRPCGACRRHAGPQVAVGHEAQNDHAP